MSLNIFFKLNSYNFFVDNNDNPAEDSETPNRIEEISECVENDCDEIAEKVVKVDESEKISTAQPSEKDKDEMTTVISESENGIADDNLVPTAKKTEEDETTTSSSKELNDEKTDGIDAQNATKNTKSNELQEVLCNGDLHLDDTSNIDVPTPNGDADTGDGDFDFDQIYDGLQDSEKGEKLETIENQIENCPELPSSEPKESDEQKESEICKSNIEVETADENDIDTTDEDLLLKSPSYDENMDDDVDAVVYSEAELLKEVDPNLCSISIDNKSASGDIVNLSDDSNIGDEPADETKEQIVEKNEVPETETEKKIEEPTECELFDLIKSTETAVETILNDTLLKKTEVSDAFETDVIEVSKNEPKQSEILLEVKTSEVITDSKQSEEITEEVTEIVDSPIAEATAVPKTVESIENTSVLSENQESKENNLLEAMDVSPVSAENSESSTSFRDDYIGNNNDDSNQIIELKDENSTDARDGFSDSKIADDEQTDKIESTDVSQSSKDPVLIIDSVDRQDSIASKSFESVVSIDDDDDIWVDEITKPEIDEPPTKRARIETTDNEESTTNESMAKNEKPIDEKIAEKTTTTEKIDENAEDQIAETTSNIDTAIETPKEQIIVDDDDDLVIIESSDTKEPQSDTELSVNLNKRPASPVDIDAHNEIRKKHKSDVDDGISVIVEQNIIEPKIDDETNSTELPTLQTDEILTPEEPAKQEENEPRKTSIDEKPEEKEDLKSEQKIDLIPKPEECPRRKMHLEFAKKFKKGFTQMSRKNLEEFVLGKIIEALVHKSEYSELKKKSEAQEQAIQLSRTKLQELNKQYRDLEMVYARLKKDVETRNQNIVGPIKITRAVGLQVCLQKPNNKEAPANAFTQAKPMQRPAATASHMVTRATAAPVSTQPKVVQPPKQQIAQRPQQIRQFAGRQITPEQPRLVTTSKFRLKESSDFISCNSCNSFVSNFPLTVQRRIVQPNNVSPHIVQVSPQRKLVPVGTKYV